MWGYDGQPSVAIALMMAAYTFVRPGELRHAELDEFDPDLAIWTIPDHKMKMGREHRVPVGTQAMKLLKDLYPISGNGKYLFPSIRSNERPMSENTVNAAPRRLGYDKTQMTGQAFAPWLALCSTKAANSFPMQSSGNWPMSRAMMSDALICAASIGASA